MYYAGFVLYEKKDVPDPNMTVITIEYEVKAIRMEERPLSVICSQ